MRHVLQAQEPFGSSPRARGTLIVPLAGPTEPRVIPACAGNTRTPIPTGQAAPGHPRVRGEHFRVTRQFREGCGSSPRARGTRYPAPDREPRRAGHPRVRGEHTRHGMPIRSLSGSSPRARGTLVRVSLCDYRQRVIPACAGNTRRPGSEGRPAAGHPRVRGEHMRALIVCTSADGSSPRARGTLDEQHVQAVVVRVIPACAGNTSAASAGTRRRSGHPRVRGEHRQGAAELAHVERVIPACAGNTRFAEMLLGILRGHPRVRGEHSATLRWLPNMSGSSPRARGTRQAGRPGRLCLRVIPACAGNTLPGSQWAPAPTGHPRVRGEHPHW